MSDPENFLTRWSRRKIEAEEAPPADEKIERPARTDTVPAKDAAPQSDDAAEPAFDLGKLPSLDSITADTDIRAFWLPGVPESLRHAALRRAWSADPAIRDFVGLEEYAWDFNAAGAMEGFGSLDPAEVPKLMKKLFGPPEQKEPESEMVSGDAQPVGEVAESTESKAVIDNPALPEPNPPQRAGSALPQTEDDLLQRTQQTAAASEENKTDPAISAQGKRGHGRALPQ